MKRRELLTLAAVSVPAGGLVLGTNPVRADAHWSIEVINDIVQTRSWRDNSNDYLRFRWGAFFYERLVRYFGPPNGLLLERSEGDDPESNLRTLLPSWSEWLQDRGPSTDSFAQINANNVATALSQVVEQNWDHYTTWLEKVGIVASGQVSLAMLSGQTLATLVSLAGSLGDNVVKSDNAEKSVESILVWLRERCFYPLCRKA